MIVFLIAYSLLKAYQTFRLDYRINIRPVVSWELPLWFRLEWHANGVVAVTCYGML